MGEKGLRDEIQRNREREREREMGVHQVKIISATFDLRLQLQYTRHIYVTAFPYRGTHA